MVQRNEPVILVSNDSSSAMMRWCRTTPADPNQSALSSRKCHNQWQYLTVLLTKEEPPVEPVSNPYPELVGRPQSATPASKDQWSSESSARKCRCASLRCTRSWGPGVEIDCSSGRDSLPDKVAPTPRARKPEVQHAVTDEYALIGCDPPKSSQNWL